MKNLRHDQKGMTLIEVIVALTIFTIISLAAIKGTTQGVIYNAEAGKKTTAVNLAQDKIEEYKLKDWGDINSINEQDLATLNNQLYKYNIDVVTNGELKTVTVTVKWKAAVERSVYLTTQISKS